MASSMRRLKDYYKQFDVPTSSLDKRDSDDTIKEPGTVQLPITQLYVQTIFPKIHVIS